MDPKQFCAKTDFLRQISFYNFFQPCFKMAILWVCFTFLLVLFPLSSVAALLARLSLSSALPLFRPPWLFSSAAFKGKEKEEQEEKAKKEEEKKGERRQGPTPDAPSHPEANKDTLFARTPTRTRGDTSHRTHGRSVGGKHTWGCSHPPRRRPGAPGGKLARSPRRGSSALGSRTRSKGVPETWRPGRRSPAAATGGARAAAPARRRRPFRCRRPRGWPRPREAP